MCYFFDPRDLWNSKNFSLHGVRCCVMNSPFVHIVFVFNAKALSVIRDAVILEFFCVPKVDWVEKVPDFENYNASLK